MIRFFFSILLFWGNTVVVGQGVIILQDKPFLYEHNPDTSVLNQLNSNPLFRTLSTKERDFFYWNNVMRKSPARFAETVLKEFLQQFPEANSSDARSLLTELKGLTTPLPFLLPEQGLIKMAKAHAIDLKEGGGTISHQSASGKGFVERMKEAGSYRCGAENVFSGSPEALDALVLLLIDKGVRDKGHRKNLLNPGFNLMGAALIDVSKTKLVLVQDFGCK